MLAIYDDRQILHRPLTRIAGGGLAPNPEQPERVAVLLEALGRLGIPVSPPSGAGEDVIAAVHAPDYLDFLRSAFAAWRVAPGNGPELRASLHPNRYMNRRPRSLLGRAGAYQADASSVLVEGTWEAARASALTAAEGARRVLAARSPVYALCRPPGHHAYRDMAGGFCYLNNAAVAAETAVQHGARVAILDVDVHHGNGTQALFERRADVLTVSVHGDPADLYPFYAGYADERGTGAGEGANLNLPVPLMSGDAVYLEAVAQGLAAVHAFAPDLVIVALGLDASGSDPFACMNVTREGFARLGAAVAARCRGMPMLLVQEGGYPSDELGQSLAAVLTGLQDAG